MKNGETHLLKILYINFEKKFVSYIMFKHRYFLNKQIRDSALLYNIVILYLLIIFLVIRKSN